MSDPRDVLVFQRSGVIQVKDVDEVGLGTPLMLTRNQKVIASFEQYDGWAYADTITLPDLPLKTQAAETPATPFERLPYPESTVAVFNGGDSVFTVDDHCYVLQNLGGSLWEPAWVKSEWLFVEALMVLRTLPAHPDEAQWLGRGA